MSSHNITAEEAANLLKEVSEEWKAFWFNHGVVAKSLGELSAALADANDDEISHHANNERNDFATWTGEVLGDTALASKLRLLVTPDAMRRMVARRVTELTAVASVVESTTPFPTEAESPVKPRARRTTAAKKATAKAAASAPVAKKESVWRKLLKR
jgi:hypothetical protein